MSMSIFLVAYVLYIPIYIQEGLGEDPFHWTELPSLNKDDYYYYHYYYYYYYMEINLLFSGPAGNFVSASNRFRKYQYCIVS